MPERKVFQQVKRINKKHTRLMKSIKINLRKGQTNLIQFAVVAAAAPPYFVSFIFAGRGEGIIHDFVQRIFCLRFQDA